MFNTPPMWRVSMICPRRITLAPTPSYLINSFCVWGTICWNDFWRCIQIPPKISRIFLPPHHSFNVCIIHISTVSWNICDWNMNAPPEFFLIYCDPGWPNVRLIRAMGCQSKSCIALSNWKLSQKIYYRTQNR